MRMRVSPKAYIGMHGHKTADSLPIPILVPLEYAVSTNSALFTLFTVNNLVKDQMPMYFISQHF